MQGPTPLRRFAALLVVLTTLAAFAGCGRKSPTGPAAAPVTSVLEQVSVGPSLGVPRGTDMPAGGGLEPSISASDSFVAGSRVFVSVVVPDSAVALLVGVTGHPGHFRVALDGPTRAAMHTRALKAALAEGSPNRARPARVAGMLDLPLVVGSAPAERWLPLVVAVEYAHSVSQAAGHTFAASARAAASGELQVSLSWSKGPKDKDADLDLHVQVPVLGDSTDIYYGNRSAAGGTLDLDSNAACAIDDVRSENISWGANAPPAGSYKVRVDLWSACAMTNADTVRFLVTLRQCGQVTGVDSGKVVRANARGGTRFSGQVIRAFDFTPCP